MSIEDFQNKISKQLSSFQERKPFTLNSLEFTNQKQETVKVQEKLMKECSELKEKFSKFVDSIYSLSFQKSVQYQLDNLNYHLLPDELLTQRLKAIV